MDQRKIKKVMLPIFVGVFAGFLLAIAPDVLSSKWVNGTNYIYPNINYSQNVNITGYLFVNDNVTIGKYLKLETPVYTDILASFEAAKLGSVAPTYDETLQAYYFSNAAQANAEEYGFVAFQLPHSYKEGGNISCHIHGFPSSNHPGNVSFEITWFWTNVNSVQAISQSLNVTTPMGGVANNLTIIDFPDFDGTNKKISSIPKIKIKRISASNSDTFTGNYYLDYVDCHYPIDSLGSPMEYRK